MKNALDQVFKKKKKVLIAYLAAGFPRFKEQKKLIKAIEEAGADVLELGVPFSDPIADGPTIQFASQQALKNNVSLRKILLFVEELKKSVKMPIVLMSYMNPILKMNLYGFAQAASRAGVSGVIIPDVIPEEGGPIAHMLKREGVHMIYLVAPTTPPLRQAEIARQTSGFLYAVSVRGVTGARKALPRGTNGWLNKLRRISEKPLCVGFGISGPQQIRELRSSVDGFIVGSALVHIIRKYQGSKRVAMMKSFVKKLQKECAHGA